MSWKTGQCRFRTGNGRKPSPHGAGPGVSPQGEDESPTQAAPGRRQEQDSPGDWSSAPPPLGGGVSHGLCASQAHEALGREGGKPCR